MICAPQITGSKNTGVLAGGIMAVLPAHLTRSVAGGFDNESVAITAMCLTFWLWVRSVRESPGSWRWGVLAGLAYVNMAAAWGGYVFVINTVGVHAALLVLLGRFGSAVHHAYSAFFVVGTLGAMTVPIINMAPL